MSTLAPQSQFINVRSYLSSMSDGDITRFITAFMTSMVVGATVLALFFRFLSMKFPPPDPNQPAVVRHHRQAGGGGGAPKGEGGSDAPWNGADGEEEEGVERTKEVKMPTKIPRPKRNIPAAAAAAMVERGDRLRGEDPPQFAEGLKCYLSLLFAAVEQGPSTEALPAHLTSCLRGAAECYKGLDDYAHAVKFLQAERMIYEEMVAQESKKKKGMQGSQAVLATLFSGKEPQAHAPHRSEVLTEVAEASMKHGYGEIGLSYRVKAAAVKQKMEGKQLDPESPEYVAIAEAMEALQRQHEAEEEEQNSGNSGPPAVTAGGGTAGVAKATEEEDLVESTAIRRRQEASTAKSGTNVRRRKGKKKDGGDADGE